jgi:hypothetical protein
MTSSAGPNLIEWKCKTAKERIIKYLPYYRWRSLYIAAGDVDSGVLTLVLD